VQRLVWLVFVAGLVAMLPALGVQVEGTSMAPALHPGQLVVLNRAAYLFGAPRRGDLVVFRSPTGGSVPSIKRVIGLPGESVLVDAGRVFVNDAPLDEPYVTFGDDYSYPVDGVPARVPEGAYFVLGDNRQASADSHLGWFVPAADVLGQAWPLP
jgi:signal peptidase I